MRRTASHAEDRAQEPQFPQGALPSDVVAAFWKTMQPNDARRERPGLRLTLRALVGLDRFANDSPLEGWREMDSNLRSRVEGHGFFEAVPRRRLRHFP
jgi:hypothetical protein